MTDVVEVSKRLDELSKRFDDLNHDVREWLEAQKSSSKRRDALMAAIIEKTLAGAVWAGIAWVVKYLWERFTK
ncbi:hypothetical protein [Aquabacterium sp.]|uniref:hypothetical protein n=1 Tax=Aquabacterium sp. TaxID=1872578 RepID=UPI004037C483